MRIHINAVVTIPQKDLKAAREAAGVEDNQALRMFVQGEALDYIIDYLFDHGVDATGRHHWQRYHLQQEAVRGNLQ